MIGITLGDPSGVGPELVVRVLTAAPSELSRRVVVFGDAGVLARAGGAPAAQLVEVTRLLASEALPGRPDAAGAAAQVAFLEAACQAAKSGQVTALVTAPISKQQASRAGFAFPGHTEFLAARLGAAEPVMMLAGPRLRVALATVHLAHADVPRRLRAEEVSRAVFWAGLTLCRDFGIEHPRIGVVGLNPHAGEGGLFGHEEETLIRPGMDAGLGRLAAEGVAATVTGPLVPDAAFRAALEGQWDVLVAMYHDQGLIPVKLVDFEQAVNVTLGLPIVRTSPDHGVAYDIAGTGRVRATSFAAALELADRLVTRR